MTTDNNQRMQEDHEDAALKLLMEEYAEIEGEALWREFQAAEAAGNNPQDREYRKAGRGSKETNRRTDFLKCVGKTGKRAAVLFLALLCLASPLVVSVEAFRLPVLNYLFTLEQAFSGFTFGRNVELQPELEGIVDLLRSAACPEGYQFSRHEISSNGRLWVYFSCDGRESLRISVFPSDGQINIDTEDVEQIPMEIHGCEVIYLPKHGHRLIWMDAQRQLVFSVHAYELEEEDFWTYMYILIADLSQ